MADTHRVLRQFTAGGTLRNPGDLVDAGELANAKALEDQRYIEPLDAESPTLSGAGPSPDPKLIQESKARAGESKNSETGGIAAMPEIEGEASAAEAVKPGPETVTKETTATKKSSTKKGK
jgi:hypothetical protein